MQIPVSLILFVVGLVAIPVAFVWTVWKITFTANDRRHLCHGIASIMVGGLIALAGILLIPFC